MENNPYQPPQSDVSIQDTAKGLASPWIRLGAAIIDGLVLFPINYVIQRVFIQMPSITDIAAAAQKGIDPQSLMPGVGSLFFAQLLGVAVYVAANFNFLKKGQTIGKKLLGLQIQRRSDGSILPVQEVILKRLGPVLLAQALTGIPFVGLIGSLFVLVDALCIFRSGRNTIHDDIAGTKVVKLNA